MLFYRKTLADSFSIVKSKSKLGKNLKIIFVHPKFRDYKIKIRQIKLFELQFIILYTVPYNPYLIGNNFFVYLGK